MRREQPLTWDEGFSPDSWLEEIQSVGAQPLSASYSGVRVLIVMVAAVLQER